MQIGLIGFGEAGSHIARGLRGVTKVCAYDVNHTTPHLGERIRQRAQESETILMNSLAALTQACDVLLCVVTAQSALAVAEQAQPLLSAGHIYADLNSVSPALKQRIAAAIAPSGAQFVEAAVMAPVPPYLHRVPILLNGPAAPKLMALLSPLGMCLEAMNAEVGAAAAVKMCRSIVVKGMEALLFECVMAASRFDAEERVFASLEESYPGMNWQQLANYMIGRVVVHGERRAHEMDEVASMLRENNIEPMMAEATAHRQRWSAEMQLAQCFDGAGPTDYHAVLKAIARQLETKRSKQNEHKSWK